MKFFVCLSLNQKKKKISEKEKEMKKAIEEVIQPFGYEIDYFKYYQNVFGNIVLKIKRNADLKSFISDRGELYYNGKMIAKTKNSADLKKVLLQFLDKIVKENVE